MIYNLVQYLKNEFPSETIYTNSRIKLATDETIPDRCINVQEAPGTESPWIQDVDMAVQIICRDDTTPSARKLAWDIYEKLESRFGLILPVVAVGGVNYPEIQTAQISANQQPYLLDVDSQGRTEFVTNYKIMYRRT